MIYQLDPDFRKTPEIGKPFCCRCQKPLRGKSIKVTVNWESWEVAEGHNQDAAVQNPKTSNMVIGNELIGADCWKTITKETTP